MHNIKTNLDIFFGVIKDIIGDENKRQLFKMWYHTEVL